MLSSAKCVLLLSDEGVNVYDVSSSRASFIDVVPWETEGFEESVADLIKRKGRGKPVVLLNDMVEQHYRKERIPKVSSFDRKSVIQNRLTAAFQAYPLRAALRLKDTVSANKADGPNGGTYLFAAVPLSEQIRKTLNAIKRSHAPIAGFSVLPVESASMVAALSKKLSKGKAGAWTLFVGQHQSGGLRQVVTRGGELALTRMTPIVDSDTDPDNWSGEVVSEIKGTMSYLSRFGYDAADGLDVIVIANNSSADVLSSKIDFECNLNILTAGEAGQLLGLRTGSRGEERYADPLHVAWAGSKSKLTLPLESPVLAQITKPAQMAMAASIILLGAAGYLGYATMESVNEWNQNRALLATAQQTLEATKVEHERQLKAKKDTGVDFLLIESATQIYSNLEKQAMKPLGTLDLIGRALGPDIHIQSLDVQPADGIHASLDTAASLEGNNNTAAAEPAKQDNASDQTTDADGQPVEEKPRDYIVTLRIVFPSSLNPESGVKIINDLQQRLQTSLPKSKVAVIKQVADLSYTGNFVGEATSQNVAKTGNKEDYEAQIQITGALL